MDEARIYYMAECRRCTSKVPFRTSGEREEWSKTHLEGHRHFDTKHGGVAQPAAIEQWIAPRGT